MKWINDQPTKQLSSIFKASIITLSIVAISGGISFAALTSQDRLTGSTIQTATANLLLGVDGVNYATSQPGFSFSGIVPGGLAVPTSGYDVYVKNTGAISLALKLSVVGNTITNPDNVDLSKVHVILAPLSGGSVQNFPLSMLIASNATGGVAILSPTQLTSGSVAVYKMQVSMEIDAVNGPSATISNLDFIFGGTVVN